MASRSPIEKEWPMIRRAWIERRAARVGSIRREDITVALGTSKAQTSADIQELLRLHPGCLTYDLCAKVYLWAGKAPLLPVPALLGEFEPAKPDVVKTCPRCAGMGWVPSRTDTDTDPCPDCSFPR